jgi:uncharacterized cupredoxin-like copper-binding protein
VVTRRTRIAVAAMVVLAGAGIAGACGDSEASTQATIGIHYSRFTPETITIRAGVPVTFELRNDDPIAHEWIVGTQDVHARHRTGTEPFHDSVPTEVTVRAFETRETTVVFVEPGEYAYICHLPGHEAYGMAGTLRVVEG